MKCCLFVIKLLPFLHLKTFFGLFLPWQTWDNIYVTAFRLFVHCSKHHCLHKIFHRLSWSWDHSVVLWRRLVSLHVERQMVGSAEASVTLGTLEWFDPCVFPVMSRQLVRPSKAPLTALPRTPVRLLTCKQKMVIYVLGHQSCITLYPQRIVL